MLTFVLVHGGWHDGSCWDEVVGYLEMAGHKAYAPTIAGNGKVADRRVNHNICTASIVDFILRMTFAISCWWATVMEARSSPRWPKQFRNESRGWFSGAPLS